METEDTNLFYTKAWQFAGIPFNLSSDFGLINLYVKWPDLNMSKGAAEVTRFDKSIWEKNGVDPKEALDIIDKEFEEADWVVGHNPLGFDIPVYRSWCRMLGRKPLPIHFKTIDTLACGKGIKLDFLYKKGDNFLSYQMKMLNEHVKKRGFATLSALCKDYGIPFDQNRLHDAGYDISINVELFRKMIFKIDI